MAIPMTLGNQGLNLQGGSPTGVLGVAQAGNNPIQGNPTISPSATSPTNPKQKYIQTQAQNVQSANPTVGNPQAIQTSNAAYLAANPNVFGTPQPSQTQNSAPIASNPVYDPYQSPQYQQYVQSAVSAAQAAMSPSQYTQGILNTGQQLADLNLSEANSLGGLANKDLSSSGMTAQQALIAQNTNALANALNTQLGVYTGQQTQAQTAANIPLTSAQTEAGYLGGIAKPQTVAPGQTLATVNPSTGQTSPLASVPSFSLGTGIAGQPVTYSQTGGQIYSGGTNAGLGATPPTLGGATGGATGTQQAALQSVEQAYGLTDPASQTALQTAVANTLASNGSTAAANVSANLVPAVNAVLSQMSGGQFSPGNAAINQTNLQQEQATANQLIAPMQTAVSHLADLQSLANAVGYTNSPIASNIRNQFSGSILTDPSITTLQSAIGVVRSEVAKVLGGGSPTVASQAEAAEALPDNLSPSNIQGVIANVTQLMNAKIQKYTDPSNAASLPTGLQMPSNSTGSAPAPGSLKL